MTAYFSSMVRQIDSSLIDEWEKLRNPNYKPAVSGELEQPSRGPSNIITDRRGFEILVRNEIFRFLRALSSTSSLEAIETLRNGSSKLTPEQLEATYKTYAEDHLRILTDPKSRNAQNTKITPSEDGKHWEIQQVLVDPDGHNDWEACFSVDLEGSAQLGEPALSFTALQAIR
jgi:hypothetical protein